MYKYINIYLYQVFSTCIGYVIASLLAAFSEFLTNFVNLVVFVVEVLLLSCLVGPHSLCDACGEEKSVDYTITVQ